MMTGRDFGLNCTIGRGPAARAFEQTVQARISSIRAFALGSEAPYRVDKGVDPVVMHPMPGVLELDHLGSLEVRELAILLRIGGPALLAVDQQRRADDACPQALDGVIGH